MSDELFGFLSLALFIIGFPLGHLFSCIAYHLDIKTAFLRKEFREKYPKKPSRFDFINKWRERHDQYCGLDKSIYCYSSQI